LDTIVPPRLDPYAERFLAALAAAGTPPQHRTPQEARTGALARQFDGGGFVGRAAADLGAGGQVDLQGVPPGAVALAPPALHHRVQVLAVVEPHPHQRPVGPRQLRLPELRGRLGPVLRLIRLIRLNGLWRLRCLLLLGAPYRVLALRFLAHNPM
jgi:hypothetical protein